MADRRIRKNQALATLAKRQGWVSIGESHPQGRGSAHLSPKSMTTDNRDNCVSKPKNGPVKTGKVDPALLSADFLAALAEVQWEPPAKAKASKADKADKAELLIQWPDSITAAAAALEPPMALPDALPGRGKNVGQLVSGPSSGALKGGCLSRPIPQKRDRGDDHLVFLLEVAHGRYGTRQLPSLADGDRLPLVVLLAILKGRPECYGKTKATTILHASGQTCVMGMLANVMGRHVALDDEFNLYVVDHTVTAQTALS